jgi:hypothetical protein
MEAWPYANLSWKNTDRKSQQQQHDDNDDDDQQYSGFKDKG